MFITLVQICGVKQLKARFVGKLGHIFDSLELNYRCNCAVGNFSIPS